MQMYKAQSLKKYFFILVFLSSCTPSFNWREFKFGDDELTFLIPCKPEQASKEVMIEDQKELLVMVACNVGAVNFTISRLQNPKGVDVEQMIELWQKASLFALTGSDKMADTIPSKIQFKISKNEVWGQEMNSNKSTKAYWRWFKQGTWIYQLGIYEPKDSNKVNLNKDLKNMFFDSIQ